MFKSPLILALILTLSACAAAAPYRAAETDAQRAYAVAASYNVVLLSAYDIVSDPEVDIRVRRAIQTAEARTTPVVNELEDALALYLTERVKFENDLSTKEKLETAAVNLAHWLLQGQQALVELVTAVKGD